MRISVHHFVTLLSTASSALASLHQTYQAKTFFEEKENKWDHPCTDECVFSLPKGDPGKGYIAVQSSNGLVDLTSAAGWKVSRCFVEDGYETSEGKRGEAPTDEIRKAYTVALAIACVDGKCASMNTRAFTGLVARLPKECNSLGFAVVTKAQVNKKSRTKGVSDRDEINVILTSDLSKAKTSVKITIAGETGGSGKLPGKLPGKEVSWKKLPGKKLPGMKVSQKHPRDLFSKDVKMGREKELNLRYDKQITLLKGSLNCETRPGHDSKGRSRRQSGVKPLDALASIDASINITPDVDIQAKVGFHISGTIGMNHSINSARVYAILDGYAGGTLDLDLNVKGELDTKEVSLLKIPITPLSIGIASIGPTLELLVHVDGKISARGSFEYGLKYEFENYELSLPKGPLVMPTATKIPPTGNADIEGSLTAHIIPRINLEIWVWKLLDTGIFLDVDASVTGNFVGRVTNEKEEEEEEEETEEDEKNEDGDEKSEDDVGKNEDGDEKNEDSGKKNEDGDEKNEDGEEKNEDSDEKNEEADGKNSKRGLANDQDNKDDSESQSSSKNSTALRVGSKYDLKGRIDVRVGAQVTGGWVTSELLGLLGMDIDRSFMFNLVTVPLFNINGTMGDHSVFGDAGSSSADEEETDADADKTAADKTPKEVSARAVGSLKALKAPAVFKGALPISISSVSGMKCHVETSVTTRKNATVNDDGTNGRNGTITRKTRSKTGAKKSKI